jgi:hypothetical protein
MIPMVTAQHRMPFSHKAVKNQRSEVGGQESERAASCLKNPIIILRNIQYLFSHKAMESQGAQVGVRGQKDRQPGTHYSYTKTQRYEEGDGSFGLLWISKLRKNVPYST